MRHSVATAETEVVLVERGAERSGRSTVKRGDCNDEVLLVQAGGESYEGFCTRVADCLACLAAAGVRVSRVAWITSSENGGQQSERQRLAGLLGHDVEGTVPPELTIESPAHLSAEDRARLFGLVEFITRKTPELVVRMVFSESPAPRATRRWPRCARTRLGLHSDVQP